MSDSKNTNPPENLGKLLDHNYDNIQELDNPLPGWWLVTFYATVIFSIGYYAYYEFMGGPTLQQELAAAMQKIESMKPADTPPSTNVDFNALAADPNVLNTGKEKFAIFCVACHGASGEGQIGPNLTDRFWIHGDGTLASIVPIVQKGVLEKGMPAWEAMMSPDELNAVIAYVGTLKGTNPPNAKAPQGNEFPN